VAWKLATVISIHRKDFPFWRRKLQAYYYGPFLVWTIRATCSPSHSFISRR